MTKRSAGILAYRREGGDVLVFLVHPGGPFWAKKDEGAWSIPKGEFMEGEEPLAVARREFLEEVGQNIEGHFIELAPHRQPGGKFVHTWAVEGQVDENSLRSNEFEMEWPPKSGRKQRFPEVDRGAWFTMREAGTRILPGQVPILAALARRLGLADELPDRPPRKGSR
jgi:predicted NUDIX family NTP pyrophosphohydrolase